MKTFYIKTFGCKVNQYESQLIREALLMKGWQEAGSPESADLCIVNGCAVTLRAEGKSIDKCRAFVRKRGRDTEVVLTGCAASSIEITGRQDRLEEVVRLVPQSEKYRILEKLGLGGPLPDGISDLYGHTRAFVKLQDGCNMGCSYCYIPVLRGPARLRDKGQIKAEIIELARAGYKEIVFTGICLGWGFQDIADLAEFAVREAGIVRVRLSSVEPFFVTDAIVSAIKDGYICPHLHIPFQSGSDGVLRRMNRDYTQGFYIDLVERLRRVIPDIAISTDIMVGFPGETDEEFVQTIEFLERVRPMRVHIFPYSRRPNTAAAAMPGHIPYRLKKERVKVLSELSRKLARIYVEGFIGQEVEVIFEEKEDGRWRGFSGNYIDVGVNSRDNLRGELVRVRLGGIDRQGRVYGEVSN